jgi:hypothetical protein
MLLASEKPIRLGSSIPSSALDGEDPADPRLGVLGPGARRLQRRRPRALFGTNVGVDLSTGKNIGIPGNGYFEATIIDEDSKININTSAGANPPIQLMLQLGTMFAQPQYVPLFEARDADDQFSDAADPLRRDHRLGRPDENLTNCADPKKPAAGSEDNIYQMLGLDYVRKNAPYDSLEELRLIRGMDDDRWATFVDPDPNDPHKRLVTVWGQDISQNPININTASPQNLLGHRLLVATADTPICSDPLQAANFAPDLLARSHVRARRARSSSWADFSKAMQGKGMVGGFLALDGRAACHVGPGDPQAASSRSSSRQRARCSASTPRAWCPGSSARRGCASTPSSTCARPSTGTRSRADRGEPPVRAGQHGGPPSASADPAATPPGGIDPDS